jgi:hypothetical protein
VDETSPEVEELYRIATWISTAHEDVRDRYRELYINCGDAPYETCVRTAYRRLWGWVARNYPELLSTAPPRPVEAATSPLNAEALGFS